MFWTDATPFQRRLESVKIKAKSRIKNWKIVSIAGRFYAMDETIAGTERRKRMRRLLWVSGNIQ